MSKPNPSQPHCCTTVYPRERWGSFHGHQCSRISTVVRNDKPYCGIHDPEKVKAKSDAADAAYKERLKMLREQDENSNVGSWLRTNDPLKFREIQMLLKP